MAGIYDTHTHLNDPLYVEMQESTEDILNDAKVAGVDMVNIVGYDVRSSKVALRQANEFPNVYAVVGVHPKNAHLYTDDAYETIDSIANGDNVVAIGEIGLDYKEGKEHMKVQKDAFKKQLDIAIKHNLPVVLHVEDVDGSDQAYEDALTILQNEGIKNAAIHAFNGSEEMANAFLEKGYYLSFNGEVTFNDKENNVIKNINLNKLLIETDSPFSTPVPFKGKVNTPQNATLVVSAIAKIKGMDVDAVIAATRSNGIRFFNIK